MSQPVLHALAARTEDPRAAVGSVARLVVGDPRAAASMTIGELAAAAGCSPSSIVRLCRELGLSGYRAFRTALAEENAVRDQVWNHRPPQGDIGEDDDIASVVRKITDADVRAVEETARGLSVEALTAVARTLVEARQVVVFGVGASGLVALDLATKLQRIGRQAIGATETHQALTAVALCGPGDVVVCLSHSGRTDDALAVVEVAGEVGAVRVCITNAPVSPIAQAADHLLLTAAHETSFRAGASASRLAQLTVVDCVFVGVAQLTYEQSHEALASTSRVLARRRSAGGS